MNWAEELWEKVQELTDGFKDRAVYVMASDTEIVHSMATGDKSLVIEGLAQAIADKQMGEPIRTASILAAETMKKAETALPSKKQTILN